jgi:hypothetical protein
LQSEPKKYKERRERKRRIGKTGNNSSARQKSYEGGREKASTQQVTVQDTMIIMTANATVTVTVAGERVAEITATGA